MLSQKNVLDLKSRRCLYQFISENPGLNLRELSRRTNIPTTTLVHHLKHLRKNSLITISSDRRFKRYYVTTDIGRREKEILSVLRQETPRNILLYLGFYVTASQLELSNSLQMNSASIAPHLKRLKELGIIYSYQYKKRRKITQYKLLTLNRNKQVNEILYCLADRGFLTNLVISYKNTLKHEDTNDEILEFIYEIFQYFQTDHKPNKNVNNLECAIDSAIDLALSFFPVPFCA